METSIGCTSHLHNHPALASFLACIPSWEKPLAYSCRLRIAALGQMNRLNPIYKGKPASQDMTTKAAMVVRVRSTLAELVPGTPHQRVRSEYRHAGLSLIAPMKGYDTSNRAASEGMW